MSDFLHLSVLANEPNLTEEESRKRNDELYRALFKLDTWFFATDPKANFENIPLIRSWDNLKWIFFFTDEDLLNRFHEEQNIPKRPGEPFTLVPDEARRWIRHLITRNVYGVHFNFALPGFFIPLKQIDIIHQHLEQQKKKQP
jgi:hypothetical protein